MANCSMAFNIGPNGEQIAVGSFYVVLSTLLLCIYVPTVTFLCREDDLMARPVFKLLLVDSICDLLQLIGVGLAAGIYSLLNNVCNRPANLFIGSIIDISWLAGGFLDLTVSLNRFLAVTSIPLMDRLFGGHRVYYWIISAILYGVGFNAIYVGRGGGVIYDLSFYAWYYADAGDVISVNAEIELAQDYIVQPIMFIFCVATAYQLIKKRKGTSHGHLNIKEKYAIYQVFIICFLLLALTATYLVLPKFTDSKWAIFAGNTLWVLVSGSFPFIVLKFNLTIREKVFNTLRGKKHIQNNQVFITSSRSQKHVGSSHDVEL